MKTGIFRDELPGERKSIINLLMTGYMVVIAILGYMAFYLNVQMSQVERLLTGIDPVSMSAEEFTVLKQYLIRTTDRLANESIWIAVIGAVFSVVAAGYTYSLIIRPLRKLIFYTETGKGELPEIKNNNEIKQLMTAILVKEEARQAGAESSVESPRTQ
ncbi:hypothetical protein [Nitrospina watsonii]|uniref:MotA/TolQ/ExbB proton channel domain-containing protein n=1 Tax=Nitrospina watsonii TaxID=1323948 RepID=A0ABN8VTY0_9BACT|nr:hypothetical protein [Nitrospina watsonii]CAI2717342.1 conserved protein of unknown function [Nitrospina watsonii]